MATTNFVDGLTVVVADWLNDVDEHVYQQDTSAHPAAHITLTPTGTIAATNVQAAFTEVATEFAHLSGATFTGAVAVPTGATGAQVPQAQEVVGKTSATGSGTIPAGTTAQRDVSPAAGYTRYNSTIGDTETYNGTEWVPRGWFELGTQATTSGTAVTFSSLPAYLKEIAIVFTGVSQSSTGNNRIRLGTSGGLVSTGYLGIRQYVNMASGTAGAAHTDGFYASAAAATVTLSGTITLRKYGTTWYIGGNLADHGSGVGVVNVAGQLPLGAALTQIEVAATAGAFDAGSISLLGRA